MRRIAIALVLAAPFVARAETGMDDAGLEAAGLQVGTITVEVSDVFEDEGQDERLVLRLADKLHVKTHEGVLLRQLVLKPGDPYSGARRRESERILRSNDYLYDATLQPGRVHRIQEPA